MEGIRDGPKPVEDVDSTYSISLFQKSAYELLYMSSNQGFRVIKCRLREHRSQQSPPLPVLPRVTHVEYPWPPKGIVYRRLHENAMVAINVRHALDARKGQFLGPDPHHRTIPQVELVDSAGSIPGGILDKP